MSDTISFPPSSGGGEVGDWGTIGGILSDQLDLQAAFDSKVSLVGYVATDNNYTNDEVLKNNRGDWLQGAFLVWGGELTINTDNTKFDIAEFHVHHTDTWQQSDHPVTIHGTYGPFTGLTPTYLTTGIRTIVLSDKNGNISMVEDIPTGEDAREYIVLGIVVHTNKTTISSISQATQGYILNIAGTFADFRYAFGTINLTGNVYSAASTDLTIKKSYGEVFGLSQNAKTNPKNPNIVSTAASDPQTVVYAYRDGLGDWTTSVSATIIPSNYDDGDGTLASVSINSWTVQPIWLATGSGTTFVQYGQKTYNTQTEAITSIDVDTIEVYPLLEDLVLRGYIVARGGAADLSDSGDALILTEGKFGGVTGTAGTTTATLQDIYLNSVDPEVLTDVTRKAVTIRGGTGTDTDNNIESQNNVGTTTMSVSADGGMVIKGTTVNVPNLPVYADNTAAVVGGLSVGDVYRTSTGELRVTYLV
jgi:hypothetical protein